jgi:hypothetical protein
MDHLIAQAVQRGGGLALRRELCQLGVSEREVDEAIRHGDLVAVRSGCYTTRDLWDSWDEFRRRPLARVHAAHRALEVEHVMSHESAALLHGLPLVDARKARAHVTRRDLRATLAEGGIHHHGAAFGDHDVQVVEGIPVLSMARTVADLARRPGGYRHGLVAGDGALRLGASRDELEEVVSRMFGWPYSRTARRVVQDADPGASNAAESLARELVLEAGLGPVETQFPIPHRGGTYFGDIRAGGRHIIEVDGRIKYRSREHGGLADRELEEILWEERSRHRDINSVGLGVSRLVSADLWGEARQRAKARLRADHEDIVSRLGDRLPPDLEVYARNIRARERSRTAGRGDLQVTG